MIDKSPRAVRHWFSLKALKLDQAEDLASSDGERVVLLT